MPQLSLEQIRQTKIKVPSLEEQIRIAEFFEKLDNLVILCQRILNEEMQMKKALTQILLSGIVRVEHG